MLKEEKITKIYKLIADKTLSFWCKIKVFDFVGNSYITTIIEMHTDWSIYSTINDKQYYADYEQSFQVIWHSVMLWDILNWREKQYPANILLDYWDWSEFSSTVLDIVSNFTEKNKPIDEQSDTCVDFLYHLMQTTQPILSF